MNGHRELNENQQLHAENLFQYESCGCNCSLMPLGYLVFFFFFSEKNWQAQKKEEKYKEEVVGESK